MLLDKNNFEEWMRRLLERIERLEKQMQKPEKPEKPEMMINGERLLDNQDLCMMLNVSKRSLQRYRSLKWLPYQQIDQKIYYLESDVEKFINEHFNNRRKSG
jgi:hypothetical protein